MASILLEESAAKVMMQNFKVPKSGGWSCYSAPSCALPNGAVGMRSLGGKSGNQGHLGLWQAGNIDSNAGISELLC